MVRASEGAVKLADLKQGMRARVVRVSNASPGIKRLRELGLIEGTEITVIKVAPLGDPVEIDLRGYRLCLRRSETDGVEVVVLGE